MPIKEEKIRDILLKQNYITSADAEAADKFASEKKGSFLDFLFLQEIITKDIFGQAMAEFYKVPYADLNSNQPSREQVLKIPEEIAKKYHAVIFLISEKQVVISTDDPTQKTLSGEIGKIFSGKKIVLSYSVSDDIDEAFVHYRKALGTRFNEIVASNKRFAPEIISAIVEDAVTYHASDIHFEPQPKEVLVRFRVDGVLQEAGRMTLGYYENVLNRIKVQGRMRIDEHSSAQDGAIRFVLSNETEVDLRVSIIPTIDGEKVVMRVLSQYVRGFSLLDIGFSESEQNQLEKLVKKPFGMILAVGPTGSGKTTTLYTILKLLNRPDVNITTIEDPVEYKIAGINQIQVNQQTGLTFSKGLRSIVRQDPNIILVGEIRDNETAEIAVNAALTGHLMLSTFHANDAATSIPRLIDLGIEPFLLASTFEVLIAQRLVRRLCESCRYSEEITSARVKKEYPMLGGVLGSKTTIFHAKGCDRCNHTGYKGRIAIFEIIIASQEIRDLIMKNPSAQDVWRVARSQGSRSLFESGLEKVKSGITTIEEVLRVAPPVIG